MDDRIRFYFDQGLTQTEIALCLSVIDDLHISVRHLRRRLSGLQLYRRRQYSDPERVVNFIASQLEGPGCLHGYRMMHERCRLKTVFTLRSTTFVMSRSRQNNFRYVEITRKLSRDHEKTRQKNDNNAWPLRTSIVLGRARNEIFYI